MKSNSIDEIEEVNKLIINLSQLKRNVDIIKGIINPGVKFMAVVKGNAYGHGLVPISKALEGFGCDCLGVVRIREALILKEVGIKIPIIMLAPLMPNQVEAAVLQDLTPMIDNKTISYELNRLAARYDSKVKVHIKVNTGLNRFGVDADEVTEYIRDIRKNCKNLVLEGIYTHFKDSEFDKHFTNQQITKFKEVLGRLEEEGLRPPIAHAAASGGILLYPESQFDMVRCDILLYGEEYLKGEKIMPQGVLPLLSFSSYITKIIEVKPGESVGYGDRYTTKRKCRIAVIGVGYGDGVSRGWKQVIINGQKAAYYYESA